MKKPSVTELISLLDKPALLNWANKQGLLGIDINKARQKYMNEGVSIHSQIEKYIKNKTPFLSEQDQINFNNFISDKEIMESEIDIETEWFTGRFDIKYKHQDKIFIADFKQKQKGLYFENKLQLIAYGMGSTCDNFAIIGVPEFNIIPVEIDNREPYEQILKSLSTVYMNKKYIEQYNL